MNPSDLLEWWNLIFVLPFMGGLIYLLFMASGVVSSEHGAEVEMEHDIDLGHEINLDHGDIGHDVDNDMEGDHDYDMENDADSGLFMRALSFLGVGKAPISILLMSFCFVWGFAGWASNFMLKNTLVYPVMFVWISLAIAAFSSVFFTRMIASVLRRCMPTTETYVVSCKDFVGKRAQVLFTITEDSGFIRVKDESGEVHDYPARIKKGEEDVTKGNKVVIMEYNDSSKLFLVKTDPLSD